MLEITYNGHKLRTKEYTFKIDKELIDDIPTPNLDNAISGSMTLVLNNEFYRAMTLANMLEKHAPKKAKRLRALAKPHNPLIKLGLL